MISLIKIKGNVKHPEELPLSLSLSLSECIGLLDYLQNEQREYTRKFTRAENETGSVCTPRTMYTNKQTNKKQGKL